MTDLHQLDIDEELSATSSSSSFVPIDKVVFDATQVIDESKQFNGHLIDYIEKTTPIGSIGNNYHIVSVFGSQSTGKSTLLNNLFHTNFDVMDESQRQQTTKGIWLAYSPAINSTMTPTKSSKHKTMGNVFVMDIEGTDGRERGEDQDFERKSALFALSTSEILIINIWEHQIGLYQGANMGLLKTVFEVNLSLFGKNKLAKTDDHKVLLLFVIRDYVGVTPIENLAATVTQDLIKMWDELNKPKELVDLKFEEFFDLKFHTLSHKILQTDKFNHDVKLLGNKFVDDTNEEYLWKDCYHHNIPIDGWTMYASNVWDQIDNNKDLDLPTQQILVAKFKCDEILNSLFTEFQAKYNELLLAKSSDSGDVDYQEIGLLMKDLKGDYLDQFQLLASKYNPSVYQTKKSLLDEKILSKYNELFNIYAKKIISKILKNFKTQLEDKSDKKFIDKVGELTKSSKHELNTNLSLISVNELKFDHFEIELTNDIEELVAKQQIIELNLIINKLIKKLSNQLNKLINFEINDVNIKSWDNIYQGFQNIVDDLLSPYASTEGYDFNLGIDNTTTLHSIESFKFKSWVKFYQLIKKNLSKESILNILKERFDNKFRYDENGIPKLYNNEFELEKNFNDSKTDALKILPQLTLIKLSNATEIVPDYDIFNKELIAKYDENYNINHHDEDDEDDDDFDDDANKFSHIISETDKTEILNKFKKEIDARYIETKRSIIQSVTSIPYYIYIIIVVLGWNEFLAIIRSPIFFTLLLLFSGIFYAMYQLNLIRPAMVVGQRMVDESITLAKAKLREFLIDDHEFHGKNLKKVSEEIEMDDLSDPKKNE